MKKQIKINPENINLFHIDIVESSIKDLTQKGNNNFKISVAHTTMHNLQEKNLKIGLYIDLDHEEVTTDANAHFVFDFHFNVADIDEYYQFKEDNSPVFSGIFIATLIGISFSTARGIIYERLSNTNMQGLILPVISPQKMLSQPREEDKKVSKK